MSPIRFRLHRIKEAVFGDGQIIYEVLIHHRNRLPNRDVKVSWERDGEFIVGKVSVGDDVFIAQARSAKEFVEEVNDTLYAAYRVPINYSEKLGGNYRLTPPGREFDALNDKAVQKSSLSLGHVEVPA